MRKMEDQQRHLPKATKRGKIHDSVTTLDRVSSNARSPYDKLFTVVVDDLFNTLRLPIKSASTRLTQYFPTNYQYNR